MTGLTTNITPTTTNSFRFNYTRNFWQWGTFGAPPQIPGMGGALEIGGESSTANLTPYNTNTQSVRRRYWDGLDKVLSDELTMIKGNRSQPSRKPLRRKCRNTDRVKGYKSGT